MIAIKYVIVKKGVRLMKKAKYHNLPLKFICAGLTAVLCLTLAAVPEELAIASPEMLVEPEKDSFKNAPSTSIPFNASSAFSCIFSDFASEVPASSYTTMISSDTGKGGRGVQWYRGRSYRGGYGVQ